MPAPDQFSDPRQSAHVSRLSDLTANRSKLGKSGVDLDREIQELRGRVEKLEALNVLAATPSKPAIVATGGKK